ncbi:Enolase- C-terminal TIM barrel domain-containing protein [Apiospora arundinis]
MRPLPGDDVFGRQRSTDYPARPAAAANNQMSFFLADEATVDACLERPTIPRPRDARKGHDSAISAARKDDKDSDIPRHQDSSRQNPARDGGLAPSPVPRASVATHSPASIRSHDFQSLSRPMTPMTLGTSCAGSIISGPSSRRNSLSGSISEIAVSSDEDYEPFRQEASSMMNAGSAPQLVMPSIQMPSRRPFTETGKSIGRLKVLVAGDSGVGKTSLIQAIVQICEHIVHVDPIVSPPSSRRSSRIVEKPAGPKRKPSDSTTQITEIFASTKPYPEWWAELDESRADSRRKSLGDSVLDRNICFVDTPGYGRGSSAMESIVPCVEYVESHLVRASSDSLSDQEMLHLFGGSGGFQVDAVLYMIDGGLKRADIEYIRRLATLTNVIPLLARADSHAVDEIKTLKQRISLQLEDYGIRPFTFSSVNIETLSSAAESGLYAVSSANGSDHDVMDASLLMSSDYVQPLVPTELDALVEQLLSPNGSSWLRHSAVKKYLRWREAANPSRPKSLYQPLSLPPTQAVSSVASTSFALARINPEPRSSNPPQLRLVDWAAELQRSMTNERMQYEALAKGERAIWLTEKLDECVQEGTLVAVNAPKDGRPRRKQNVKQKPSRRTLRHQDPPRPPPGGG